MLIRSIVFCGDVADDWGYELSGLSADCGDDVSSLSIWQFGVC